MSIKKVVFDREKSLGSEKKFFYVQNEIIHKEIIFSEIHLSHWMKNIIREKFFHQKKREMSRKSTHAVNHISLPEEKCIEWKKYPWKAINSLMWKNHRTFNFREIFFCSHQQLNHIELRESLYCQFLYRYHWCPSNAELEATSSETRARECINDLRKKKIIK